MRSPSAGALRAVRAAVVAVVVVGLALAGHVLGGGAVPGPVPLAAVAVLVTCASVLLTRRRLSPAALLALLGGAQVVLHRAFMAFDAAACLPAPVGGHAHHAAAAVAHGCGAALPGGAQTAVPPDAGWPLLTPMVLAHVLATVATAVLLARGEAAVWSLLVWLTPLVRVLVLLPLPVAPARAGRRSFPEPARPRPTGVRRRTPRRGPPAVSGFLPA